MADLKAELDARARSYICSYCNIASVPVSLEYIIPLMVAEDLNATGILKSITKKERLQLRHSLHQKQKNYLKWITLFTLKEKQDL